MVAPKIASRASAISNIRYYLRASRLASSVVAARSTKRATAATAALGLLDGVVALDQSEHRQADATHPSQQTRSRALLPSADVRLATMSRPAPHRAYDDRLPRPPPQHHAGLHGAEDFLFALRIRRTHDTKRRGACARRATRGLFERLDQPSRFPRSKSSATSRRNTRSVYDRHQEAIVVDVFVDHGTTRLLSTTAASSFLAALFNEASTG